MLRYSILFMLLAGVAMAQTTQPTQTQPPPNVQQQPPQGQAPQPQPLYNLQQQPLHNLGSQQPLGGSENAAARNNAIQKIEQALQELKANNQ